LNQFGTRKQAAITNGDWPLDKIWLYVIYVNHLITTYNRIKSLAMDEIKNPYAPGAGIQPPELTGRDNFLSQATITVERALNGKFGKSFIATGLRGVGKTVLLNRVKNISTDRGCITSFIEIHEDKGLDTVIAPVFRKILLKLDNMGAISAAVKKGLRILVSFIKTIKLSYEGFELGFDPEIGSADSGDLELDLADLFLAVGLAAKSRNTVVVLVLDEIQYLSNKEMSALVMAMHKSSQEELPLVLIGAGLPLLVGKMGESKSYAERLFAFPTVGALSYEDSALAIDEPAKREGAGFDIEALKQIYSLTHGYPYFLQEWAYVCWNISEGPIINATDVANATPKVISKLDESFFRVRFDRLTRREKQYLRAMAELGPGAHRSGDIAEMLRVAGHKLGPCRSGLISKGMIYSPSYGDTAFTVPLFDQYMKRAMSFSPWNEVD